MQVDRASRSGSAFALGLFEGRGPASLGGVQPVSMTSESVGADRVLRFHKACDKYRTSVKNNATLTQLGEGAAAMTAALAAVREGVTERLGLPEADAALLANWLGVAWDACKMESLVLQRVGVVGDGDGAPGGGICALFSAEEVEALEYASDVESYWVKGHGLAINHDMACLLVTEVLDALRRGRSDDAARVPREKRRLADFRFAHAETVIPLVAALGLFRDAEPLMAGQPSPAQLPGATVARRRAWRISAIAPMGANVALTLHRCGGGGQGQCGACDPVCGESTAPADSTRVLDETHAF